ncbi:AAA family ATPase [Hymenobacter sp. H14-R3]|uniref:AAA family ATPase n=1 Tax=Hymenobacter sp. H14-R3 TaxID=3046308 RepID=UPI0024BA0460|nr:AAA family ATPase [Hymenobacter sp. H14-R3]MDJ0366467.1 AAA family ATPase [Hymenobacter sp. H14-R3]
MPFYVISGGPGAGKTTLLAALRRASFAGADEVARQLTREQVALGSGLAPWLDLAGFAELARARTVANLPGPPWRSAGPWCGRWSAGRAMGASGGAAGNSAYLRPSKW